MQALIVGEHEEVTTRLRQGLMRHGYDCPATHVVPPDLALPNVHQFGADLLVVVLSPESERMLDNLGELRAQAKGPILAVGPITDAHVVLRALRTGANEYLDEAELEQELEGGLRRCRESAGGPGPGGRVFGVLGTSGGCGCSTLAANLAAALAHQDQTSLLMDLALQGGDLASLFDLKPTYALADLCQQMDQLDQAMLQRSLVAHAGGVHLIAAPQGRGDADYVTPEGVGRALALGRGLFPTVVLDLERPFRAVQTHAVQQADLVLVVLRLDFTCLRNTKRALDYLSELEVSLDRVRLVVNRSGQAREVPVGKAEQALGMKIFHHVPDDPRTINQANNQGVPAVLYNPSARVCRSMTELAARLKALPR